MIDCPIAAITLGEAATDRPRLAVPPPGPREIGIIRISLLVLTSLLALVVTVMLVPAFAVGVPVTGQTMDAPGASVAGDAGVQAPTLMPAGSPLTEHVAPVADRVTAALLVQRIVPLYGTPTEMVVGMPRALSEIDMSAETYTSRLKFLLDVCAAGAFAYTTVIA